MKFSYLHVIVGSVYCVSSLHWKNKKEFDSFILDYNKSAVLHPDIYMLICPNSCAKRFGAIYMDQLCSIDGKMLAMIKPKLIKP